MKKQLLLVVLLISGHTCFAMKRASTETSTSAAPAILTMQNLNKRITALEDKMKNIRNLALIDSLGAIIYAETRLHRIALQDINKQVSQGTMTKEQALAMKQMLYNRNAKEVETLLALRARSDIQTVLDQRLIGITNTLKEKMAPKIEQPSSTASIPTTQQSVPQAPVPITPAPSGPLDDELTEEEEL